MFLFSKWLRQTFHHALLGRRRRAHLSGRRLALEALEDRVVPTVLFQPVFGAETTSGSAEYNQPQNGVPVNTPVNLVFLGTYWNSLAGQNQRATIESQVLAILASPFLSGLTVYNSSGMASFLTDQPLLDDSAYQVNAQGNTVFNGLGALTGVVNSAIAGTNPNGTLPGPTSVNTNLYVVFTPPGVFDSNSVDANGNPTAAGWNQVDQLSSDTSFPLLWVSTTSAAATSSFFSHELVETMTDGGGAGVMATAGANFHPKDGITNGQIADFEPNKGMFYKANVLDYGLDSGVAAQAYWTNAYGGQYIVPDGQQQTFEVIPQWSGSVYDGTSMNPATFQGGALTIIGGEHGNQPDTILVDTNAEGGVAVTVDGDIASFPAGEINFINISTVGAGNSVEVLGDPKGVPISINVSSADTVTVGNGTLNNIASTVYVEARDRSSPVELTVDNSADSTGSGLGLGSGTWYTGLSSAGIEELFGGGAGVVYDGNYVSPTINLGPGSNFVVDQTGPQPTTLNTNGNEVSVLGTSGLLVINGQGSSDTVDVGNIYGPLLGSGSLAGIAGVIEVANLGGSTNLVVDDGSVQGTVGNLESTFLLGIEELTDLSAGDIIYNGNQVSLTVWLGSGSTLLVSSTGKAQTTVDTTGDTVDVFGTSGPLMIAGQGEADTVNVGVQLFLGLGQGSLSAITGGILVANSGGTTQLVVDDGGVSGATGTLQNVFLPGLLELTGLSAQPIGYSGSQVSPTIYLGAGSGLTVTSSGTATTTINAKGAGVKLVGSSGLVQVHATGSSLVLVGGGSLESLQGGVLVDSTDQSVILAIDDSTDATPHPAAALGALATGYDVLFGLGSLIFYSDANPNIPATISLGATTTLTVGGLDDPAYLLTNGGKNTINVWATNPASKAGASALTITSGAGSADTINVGTTSNPLDGIFGKVAINGNGSDALTINDEQGAGGAPGDTAKSPPSVSYDITAQQVTRTANFAYTAANGIPTVAFNELATIAYSKVSSLQLNGSNVGASYTVQGTSAATTVATGSGNDTFSVAGTDETLNAILNPLTIDGGRGSNTLMLNDQGDRATHAYTVTSSTVSRDGATVLAYRNVSGLTLDGSSGNDTFLLQSTLAATPVSILGGSGNDTFQMSASASALAGALTLDGGGSGNTLDYSGYPGTLVVDLPLGSATNVKGGIRDIQNVTGSKGNDILVGNGGNVLRGGTGRNILIAGPTASTLVGGSDQDVLVGGSTSYDRNITALDQLMAEWAQTGAAYLTRVQNWLGSSAGAVALKPATFQSNGGNNTLTGGAGLDVFYGLLPGDGSTPDKSDWNPAQGEVFIDPHGINVGIQVSAPGFPANTLLVDGIPLSDPATPQQVNLRPGSHLLQSPGGLDSVPFTVDAAGNITFATSLKSVLSSPARGQLVVKGVQVTVNASALTDQYLYVDHTGLTEQTAAPFTLTLLPGNHLFVNAGGLDTVPFQVDATGSITYSQSLNGVLSSPGRGQLVVKGVQVKVNASALTDQYLYVDHTGLTEQTAAPFTLTLLPGNHLFVNAGGLDTVPFQVDATGTITYDASLNGTLSSPGRGQLVVNGVQVKVNASALTDQYLYVDHTGLTEQTAAPFTLTLLPGNHLFVNAGGLDTVPFQVDATGSITYSQSLNGVLSSPGRGQLVVKGVQVTVNASALTDQYLYVDHTGLTEQTAAPFTLTLLPGNHLFVNAGGLDTVPFQVDATGSITYSQSLNGVLSSPGRGQLVVKGVQVKVNASALTDQYLYVDHTGLTEQTAAPFTLTLLPGNHLFVNAGGLDTVPFQVDATGTITYDASLNGTLSSPGRGQLVVNGVQVKVNASALTDQYLYVDHTGLTEQTAAPFTLTLLPGNHLFVNAGGLDTVPFQVDATGSITYSQSLNGVLSSPGRGQLVVKGVQVTVNASALTDQYLYVDHTGLTEQTAAPFILTLLPGKHLFVSPGGGPVLSYSIGTGTITYPNTEVNDLSIAQDGTLLVKALT